MSFLPRIAFVTEPLPVRSGPRDFEGPFLRFCSIADALHRSGTAITYIVATDDLIENYDYSCYSLKGSDLGFCQTWPNNWRPNWINILQGYDINQINSISTILKNERLDLLFLWSKNDTIRKASILAGIPVIHVELGPIRSPNSTSWIFDPRGIGPDSLVSKIILNSKFDVSRQSKSSLKLADLCATTIRPKTFYPKKRVLFPLQVEDDINNILWNPWGDQAQSTKEILKMFSRCEDIELTVRQHPASEKDYSTIIEDFHPSAIYDYSKNPVWDHLVEWDALVHINSSLGFEARLCGLNVCSLGASKFCERMSQSTAIENLTIFINDLQICKNKNNIDKNCINSYHILSCTSLVDERISVKPSFYLKIAMSLQKFPGDIEQWFELLGIQEVVEYIRTECIDSDFSILRAENHRRIIALNDLSMAQIALRRNVDALLQENQIRIDEISLIRKSII